MSTDDQEKKDASEGNIHPDNEDHDDALDQKIRQFREKINPPFCQKNTPSIQGGWRYVIDFLSALLLGSFLGHQVDRFFSTSPFGMIVGSCLGFCAGVWNLYRSAKVLEKNKDYINKN